MERFVAVKQPHFSARDRFELGVLIAFVVIAVAAAIWVDARQATIVQSSADANIDVYASAMPNNGWAPLTVYYSAFGSQSPNGAIVRYEWDLDGNGAFEFDATQQGGYASYLYTKPGDYEISLRVTDQAGNTAIDSTTITVQTPASSSVDYWSIFDDTRLQKVTISLAQSDWEAMWEDVEAKLTVPADANVFGETLEDVGFRFRGQFSMRMSGEKKPFKIDTDYFVFDQEYKNLKQLMFINNIGDASMMQEKLMYEMMQFAGLPASFVSYVELWIDISDNDQPPEYWGVYSMVERVDQKFVGNRFGRDAKGGNLYKASHAQFGPMDLIYYGPDITNYPSQNNGYAYSKVNNEEEADYSDVIHLMYVIDGVSYDTPEDWAAAAEEVINVDSFLRYMAVTDLVGNWDSYPYTGNNYYLFYNQIDERFEWIPWDLSWGGEVEKPLFQRDSFGMVERVPMYDNAFQVERYRVQYAAYLDLLTRYYFNPTNMNERVRFFYQQISPMISYGTGDKMFYAEDGWFQPADFDASVQHILTFTEQRNQYIRQVLSTDDWRNPTTYQSQGGTHEE